MKTHPAPTLENFGKAINNRTRYVAPPRPDTTGLYWCTTCNHTHRTECPEAAR
jgi:hypothetical protein